MSERGIGVGARREGFFSGTLTMMTATQARAVASEKPKDSGWESTGKLLAFVVLMIVGTIYCGLVIRQMWGWFIVPGFGAVPLSLVTAIGVDLLFMTLRGYSYDPEAQDKDLGQLVALGFKRVLVGPTMLLIIGFVTHLFA